MNGETRNAGEASDPLRLSTAGNWAKHKSGNTQQIQTRQDKTRLDWTGLICMAESDLSVRALYSTLTDEELDQCVIDIKSRQPHSGYRMVKGLLQAQGLWVQYERVRASMHRVETIGVISRITNLGCIVRRTYSVPSP